MHRGVIFALLFLFAPLAVSAQVACPSLSLGSTGASVTAVQKILYAAYANFPAPTGYFGPTTFAALKQWQKENGLESVGSVGPKTAAAMKLCTANTNITTPAVSSSANPAATPSALSSATRTLSRGLSGPDVTALQQFLISQQLLSADSATGFFGALTEAAVQKFQVQTGIASSGTPATTGYGAVGPKTRATIAAKISVPVSSQSPESVNVSAGMSTSANAGPSSSSNSPVTSGAGNSSSTAGGSSSTGNSSPATSGAGNSSSTAGGSSSAGNSTPVSTTTMPVATSTMPQSPVDTTSVPPRIIFEDHFNSGQLSSDRWFVEGWAGYTSSASVGSGDWALKLTGDGTYKTGVRTFWPFERGGNLTAQFIVWHDASMDVNTVSGPWLSTPTMYKYDVYPYLNQVEAGLTGQENGPGGAHHIQWGEGSIIWAWSTLNNDFSDRWLSATSKAKALTIRVQLGDSSGARMSWSADGVTFYKLTDKNSSVIDSIGKAAGIKATALGNNLVSSSKVVWLGFGGARTSATYVDDIVVYRNETPLSRNVSALNTLNMLPAASAIAPTGWRYSDTIPDTLDLAQRLSIATDGLTNSVVNCPAGSPWYCNGSVYSNLSWAGSVDLSKGVIALANMHTRVLPLSRAASGNAANLSTDIGYLRYYLNQSWYNKPGGYTYPYMSHTDALTAMSLYNWFIRDYDLTYLTFTRFIADGISSSILRSGDRAYFPYGGKDHATGKWSQSVNATGVPYTTPDEPVLDQIGNEGTVKWNEAMPMLALMSDWREEENQQALSTAAGIKNFLLKPSLGDRDPSDPTCAKTKKDILPDWTNYCVDYSKMTSWNGYVPKYPTTVYATASGQSDSILTSLQGLLSYALATNDSALKSYVKNGLDHVIGGGIFKLGWVPYWSPAGSWNFNSLYFGHAEVGGLGDLVILEIAATENGLGDYWDYVDLSVRNALSEAQISDMTKLRSIAGTANLDKVFGRFTNAALPDKGAASSAGDGDANAVLGLYYAWDAIMRYDGRTARVNLALNKAAEWGDVYSWLPYQGQILYKNKWADRVKIRIPGWVSDLSKVTVQVNGTSTTNFTWAGRYVLVEGLQPGTSVGVSFPVTEQTWQFNWNDTPYTAKIRGSTVISITQDGPGGPTAVTDPTYKFYTNGSIESFRAAAPQKTVTRFVSDRRFPLQFEPYIGVYK